MLLCVVVLTGGSRCACVWVVLDACTRGPPGRSLVQLRLTGIGKHHLVPKQVLELQAPPLLPPPPAPRQGLRQVGGGDRAPGVAGTLGGVPEALLEEGAAKQANFVRWKLFLVNQIIMNMPCLDPPGEAESELKGNVNSSRSDLLRL